MAVIGFWALLAICILVWPLRGGVTEEGLSFSLRVTARLAVLPFLAAFLASALYFLRRHFITAWVLKRRRSFGLGFSAVMFVHLAGIVWMTQVAPERFADARLYHFLPGGVFFLAVSILTLTSFSTWRSRLAPITWKRLHRRLSWFLCLGFGLTFFLATVFRESIVAGACLVAIAVAIPLRVIGERGRNQMFAARRNSEGEHR